MDEVKDEAEFVRWLQDEEHYLTVKVLPNNKWAAVKPLMFTFGIMTGEIGDEAEYDDRWCYDSLISAILALDAWDGSGEPSGWHRHPSSGRRIARTVGEYDGRGRLVPVGEEYVSR